jgi:hypothetical protein
VAVQLSGINVALVGVGEDAQLDAQELIAERVGDGPRPALLLTDGETTVRVTAEVGSREQAAERLLRLAATALALAEELRPSG